MKLTHAQTGTYLTRYLDGTSLESLAAEAQVTPERLLHLIQRWDPEEAELEEAATPRADRLRAAVEAVLAGDTIDHAARAHSIGRFQLGSALRADPRYERRRPAKDAGFRGEVEAVFAHTRKPLTSNEVAALLQQPQLRVANAVRALREQGRLERVAGAGQARYRRRA